MRGSPYRKRLALGVVVCLAAERMAWVFAASSLFSSDRRWASPKGLFVAGAASLLFVLRRFLAWHMAERVLIEEHANILDELLGAARGQRFAYEVADRTLVARIEIAKILPLAAGESVAALVFGLVARASAGFAYYLIGYAILALLVYLFRTRIHAWSIAQSEHYLPVIERVEWLTRAQEEILANGSAPWVRSRFAEAIARWRRETFGIDAWLMIVSRWPLAVFGGAVALSVLFFERSRGTESWIFAAAAMGSAASAVSLWLAVARAHGRGNLPSWRPREVTPLKGLLYAGEGIRFTDADFAFVEGGPVIRSLTFDVPRGTLAVLAGENGSGKSTVLRLAAGLLLPSSGKVESEAECAGVAYLPQRSEVLDASLPEASWALLGEADPQKSCFAHPKNQPIANMSGGERKKFLLNRLLAAPKKSVYLLDEPDAALDEAAVELLVGALMGLKEGAAILVASHHPRVLAAADQVIDLSCAAPTVLGTKVKRCSAG